MEFKKLTILSIIAVPIILFDVLIINSWKFVYEHNKCYIKDCGCVYNFTTGLSEGCMENCKIVETICFGINPLPLIFATILALSFTVLWIYLFAKNL